MSKAREFLRSVKNLGILRDLAKSGGGLDSVADLVDNFIDSEAMAVCVERFRDLPGGAELLERRYPPFQPNVDVLARLPQGSLGHAYAAMIRTMQYDPDFFRPRDTSTDALWLTQRIATTHDIHHVIAGFNTQPAGESGVLAITATQIGFPAYVLLNLLATFKAVRIKPSELEAISNGIAHGNRIALEAAPLVTQRWEEGWEKPLAQWRQDLGIKVPDHPAVFASYS